MKKKFLLPLLAVMIAFTTGRAEESDLSQFTDAVYVQSTEVARGTQQTLSIQMKNSFSVQTIQFDLYLPAGLTVVNEDGLMTESKERISKFNYFESSLQGDGAIRLLAQATTTNFAVGEGEIAKVKVSINAETAPGDYPISVKNIKLVSKDNVEKHVEEVTTKITVTSCLVLDETSTTAPGSATGVNVCVLRTINANEWSTICLPFAMSEAQIQTAFGEDVDVELADFTGYDLEYDDEDNVVGINVLFNDAHAIEANHPYIIKVSQPVTQITVDGVDVEPTDYPGVCYGSEYGRPKVYHPKDFIGTYVADFNFFADAQSGHAIFLNSNKFWYATASTKHMKAFRAYFDFDDVLPEAENSVKMYFNKDGELTRINELMPETSDDAIYDLAGRKVEKAEKGIYIVNGKKVLVK
ncbi:MAG: hypothetical protein J5661_04150 [Bacteroidaceae bacterium]|nr:hypothetical protein [Bacteroidaceae bacterium]